jgi:hypothetical protein
MAAPSTPADPDLAVLTDTDARRVMEGHFGAPLSLARQNEDGSFSIELMGMLPSGDEARRAALSATSASSFEAALRDLAVRRSDLLEVPIDDVTGLFVRLRYHRTKRDGLFQPRDAPLTSTDCARLDELDRVAIRLREALRPKLAWSSAGIGGFNVEVYAQFMLHRILALVDGAASAWNGRNGLASAILARGALESVAVWVKVTKDAERHIANREFDDFDKLIARIFFARKNEPSEAARSSAMLSLSPIHVLTAVDTLEKEYVGVRRAYDDLSEVAHPNGESFFAISAWQDVDLVSFDPAGTGGDLLGKILSAIRLDIAGDYLVRWEKDLAPRLGRLWREVHGVRSVDNNDGST